MDIFKYLWMYMQIASTFSRVENTMPCTNILRNTQHNDNAAHNYHQPMAKDWRFNGSPARYKWGWFTGGAGGLTRTLDTTGALEGSTLFSSSITMLRLATILQVTVQQTLDVFGPRKLRKKERLYWDVYLNRSVKTYSSWIRYKLLIFIISNTR